MSHITTCPHCSARLSVSDQITDKPLICPHCHANLNKPQPEFQIHAANINTDVKRGRSLGSIILAVLIGLCVLGIAFEFFASREGERGIGRVLNLGILFVALDILVGIAIVRGLIRRGSSGASGGRVLGIALLSFGMIVAVIIFFFFTCLVLAG